MLSMRRCVDVFRTCCIRPPFAAAGLIWRAALLRDASAAVQTQISCQMLAGSSPGLTRFGRKPYSSSSVVTVSCMAQQNNSQDSSSIEYDDWIMTENEREFWSARLRLTRQHAIESAKWLNLNFRLGLPDIWQTSSRSENSAVDSEDADTDLGDDFDYGTRQQRPNCWETYKEAKKLHPLAIALVKVGSFYETVGVDAVLLMEHCGLNAMGTSGNEIPRAGCPENNVQMVLQDLVAAGLDVAVWEERDDKPGAKDQKNRDMKQLVNAENPLYLYGYSRSSSDLDVATPTIAGVSESSRGLDLYIFQRSNSVIQVHQNLSEEGMWGLLQQDRSGRMVVWLHLRPDDEPGGKLQKLLEREDVTLRVYRAADGLQGFKDQLRERVDLGADMELLDVSAFRSKDWPGVRQLYLSTASQLGLERTSQMPALESFLLPEGSASALQDLMAAILVAPPTHHVATGLRTALSLLMSQDQQLPAFLADSTMTPSKVQLILGAREPCCNEGFFHNLLAVLLPVQASLEAYEPGTELAQVVENLWPLMCHLQCCEPEKLIKERVLDAVSSAVRDIKQVVPEPSDRDGSLDYNDDKDGEGEEEEEVPVVRKLRDSKPNGTEAQAEQKLQELLNSLDGWSYRVHGPLMRPELEQVEKAQLAVLDVLKALLKYADQQLQNLSTTQKTAQLFDFDVDKTNDAVWVKVAKCQLRSVWDRDGFTLPKDLMPAAVAAGLSSIGETQRLERPWARDGTRVSKRDTFSFRLLDESLDLLREAVYHANTAALNKLNELACKLHSHCGELAAAVQFATLAAAMTAHASAATQAGWTLPDMGPWGTRGSLDLRGLWPYWMSMNDGETVRNDVELDGFLLLTGPNMAGKSTMLRALAAAALCGNCGLAIPAAAGSKLPQLDAVMLRAFSGDAPREGLSAFAVEMKQMATVLEDVGPHSLVLIDELGKGTEVLTGTAMASAILKSILKSGSMGIFATHLHLLVPLLNGVPRLSYGRMEVLEKQRKPTWRLQPGYCTGSLALDVAAQQGLPGAIVQRAQQEVVRVRQLGAHREMLRLLVDQAEGDISDINRIMGRTSSSNGNGSNGNSSNGGSSNGKGSSARKRRTGSSRTAAKQEPPNN